MLPMISSVGELQSAIGLIDRAYKELTSEEGLSVARPPIGAMIEVPAMVYQVKALARQVDFLSVGTNDLTQYLLAVDRNNPRVANLYTSFHPSVLRALQIIGEHASAAHCEVSVCGELAGDPMGAVILSGLGYRHLSMSAGSLPRVKSMLMQVTHEKAKGLAKRALRMDDAAAVGNFLSNQLGQPELAKLYSSP